ncbi:MAG: hypothetical protein EBQ71_03885 [Betaproteobacteria bacterium]|nr:hypothetical protein [Betaproteobacteria bacterium]
MADFNSFLASACQDGAGSGEGVSYRSSRCEGYMSKPSSQKKNKVLEPSYFPAHFCSIRH